MRSKTGIMIAVFIIGLIEYYAFVAMSTATKNIHPGLKIGIFAFYLLLSVLTWVFIFSFRKLSPESWHALAKTLVFAFLLGFLVAKIVMAAFMMLDDLRRIITWISQQIAGRSTPSAVKTTALSGTNPIPRSQFIARAGLLVGGLLLGGFLWGSRNKYNYQIKRLKLKLKQLPDAFKGLKIVQISDIHSGSFDDARAVAEGVNLILLEKPDIILFTGDLVNNRATEIEPYIPIFKKLKAPMGVYSILGNHDYGDYVSWSSEQARQENLEKLKAHQATLGWKLMMNEHLVFEREGQKIALLGIENWSAKPRFPRHGSLKKAYAGLAGQDVPLKILMSHDPSHWEAEVLRDYPDIQLTLSGHTHGMQFGLRLPFLQWSPVQYMYKQWAGLYREKDQYLYVNVGYGFLGYPGRLGIKPEITVIELV